MLYYVNKYLRVISFNPSPNNIYYTKRTDLSVFTRKRLRCNKRHLISI